MKPKNQRLVLVVTAIVAVGFAVLLAMWGLRERASYFYTPADVVAGKAEQGRSVRLGGMVETGSIQRQPDGVTIGEHSIVGAGSLVRKDVPARTVVAGNPAKVIRPVGRSDGRIGDNSGSPVGNHKGN